MRIAPLAGVRVLDFGHYLAGPLVGYLLADLGADVVKVDGPQSIRLKDPLAAVLDRGKRCLTLDLKRAEDRSKAFELVRDADIVIENFRPGVFDRLGFSIEALRRDNPAVIRLSLPGFSRNDAVRRRVRAFEGVIAAAAGVLSERGPNQTLRGKGPGLMPMPMASAYAAAFGCVAVLAAWLARLRTGCGDDIETPLFNALIEGFSYNHMKIHELPERYVDGRARALATRRDASATAAPSLEEGVQSLIDPMYRSFLCRDGRWLYLATPAHRGLVEKTLRMFGLWEALLAEGLPADDPYISSAAWRRPEEGSIFGLPKLSQHWMDVIRKRIASRVQEEAGAYWEEQIDQAGLCGALVRTSQEWLSDPATKAAGHAVEFLDPALGWMIAPGSFLWFEGADPNAALPAREFGDAEAFQWRAQRLTVSASGDGRNAPPLADVRILDLCNVIAGPTVAGVLARFGADVVKIDDLKPGFDPFITVVLGLQAGRGKRSALLDLRRSQGKAAFDRLAQRADLVTFNGPSEQLERLGLNPAALRALNPRLGVVQVTAFAGALREPRARRKGVDEVLQAATGVMARMSSKGAPPEEYAHFGTVDVITGVLGAAAALAGLIARENSGLGSWTATSLAAGASTVQLPFLWARRESVAAPDFDCCETLGTRLGERIYQVSDGYIFVAVPPEGETLLLKKLGATDERGLEQKLAELTFEACERLLPREVFGLHRLESYAALRLSLGIPEAMASDAIASGRAAILRYPAHPVGGPVDLAAQSAIWFERALVAHLPPAPKYGAHTREILSEAGYGPLEIDDLLRADAAQQWPHHLEFLPT